MNFLLVANFKMNLLYSDIKKYIEKLNNSEINKNIDLVISPTSPYLSQCFEKLDFNKINLSAQNMYFEEKGAFTGEFSGEMLKDLGCNYVILGHSERRENFGETNEIINKKIISAIKNEIRPILCIGENLEIKNNGKTNIFLEKQIIECTKGVKLEDIDIAYEPIWAIGTGQTATIEYIEKVHLFINHYIGNNCTTRILYGGSVKVENGEDISKIKNVNGLLIGGEALDVDKFLEIGKKV